MLLAWHPPKCARSSSLQHVCNIFVPLGSLSYWLQVSETARAIVQGLVFSICFSLPVLFCCKIVNQPHSIYRVKQERSILTLTVSNFTISFCLFHWIGAVGFAPEIFLPITLLDEDTAKPYGNTKHTMRHLSLGAITSKDMLYILRRLSEECLKPYPKSIIYFTGHMCFLSVSLGGLI